LHQAIPLYKKLTGRRQLSWNCRSFPSVNTLDLLARAASSIIPTPATTYFIDHAGRRILVVPYSKTLNNGRYLIAPGYGTPRGFTDDCRSAIDYMLSEADETFGRTLTIGIHCRWTGHPDRASGLREVIEHVANTRGAAFMRRLDIGRHWLDHHESFERRA
jgi:hypothetical protein